MNELFLIKKDNVRTTSRIIAKEFSKKHENVLKAIRRMECSKHFNAVNFDAVKYVDGKGESRTMYEITRDGFMFLVMGFTGKKAAEKREEFIYAFNYMEKMIFQKNTIEWKETRKLGKEYYKQRGSVVEEFVNYAINQGSKSAKKYHICLPDMQKKALGLVKEVFSKDIKFRDALNVIELNNAMFGDVNCALSLKKGMSQNLYYKDIYKLAKKEIIDISKILKKDQKLLK